MTKSPEFFALVKQLPAGVQPLNKHVVAKDNSFLGRLIKRTIDKVVCSGYLEVEHRNQYETSVMWSNADYGHYYGDRSGLFERPYSFIVDSDDRVVVMLHFRGAAYVEYDSDKQVKLINRMIEAIKHHQDELIVS